MPYNEFWIAVRTDSQAGRGTFSDPYNGNAYPQFDALMRSFGTNVTLHLFPGTYETLGWSNGDTRPNIGWRPKTGWRILGAGIDNTTIKLVEEPSPNQNRWDNAVIGSKDNGADQRANFVEVLDLTIDCNL